MGCISKQRAVGGAGCFEDSVLLPKWNFWHDLQVLEFPFLCYSQDCRKEWLHIIWASYHHVLVLPCFVTHCKWNLSITCVIRIRKMCSVTMLIPLNQIPHHVNNSIWNWVCFCIFPEHLHTHSDVTSKTGLPLSVQVLSSDWVAMMWSGEDPSPPSEGKFETNSSRRLSCIIISEIQRYWYLLAGVTGLEVKP